MSIPLDRLYQYVESIVQDICQDRVVIYRFYPHGSKNFEDLKETFIDVPINIIEYNNPIMSKPQKIIRIDWS